MKLRTICPLKYHKHFFAFLILCGLTTTVAMSQSAPMKKRADNYFGIHFDFHASYNDSLIGKTLTEHLIDTLLTEVKPDILQVDCKGHKGYSSYPTKYGNQTKGYVNNPLVTFRKVTKKYGIPVYIHYSGLIDRRAIELHPEWAMINADGTRSKELVSLYSDYLDSLMIPQLKEVSDFGFNGAWTDGDCWGAMPDYSPKAIAEFTKRTGISKIPQTPTDENYYEWLEFNRSIFKDFLRKFTDAIHQYNPTFDIGSNWAYTNYMPDSIDVAVDYLSGDLSSNSTVYAAAFASRTITQQGLPWDLMSWRHSHGFHSSKSMVELKMEASQVISNGGGYEVYIQQFNDASFAKYIIPEMKELGQFVRDRQAYCQYSKPIPEVAVLLSTYGFHKENDRVYGERDTQTKDSKGIATMLLDAKYNVQVVMEHNLHERMNEYKVIVIPGWNYLQEGFRQELLTYVSNGGKLLLTGPGPIKLFKNELGIENLISPTDSNVFISFNHDMGLVKGAYAITDMKDNVNSGLSKDYKKRGIIGPASFAVNYGKGKIGAITVDLGNSYMFFRVELTKDFLDAALKQLMPEKEVEINSTDKIMVNYVQVDAKKYIHLMNMGGDHDNPNVFHYNYIPEIFNIPVSVKTDKKPKNISIQPGNQKVDFKWENNRVSFIVPELKIFSVVQIDY